MRLIDADKTHEALKALCEKYRIAFGGQHGGFAEGLAGLVDEQPTVYPNNVVKHGQWKINSDGYYPYCSECGKEPQGREMTDFCPNCGAKMYGENDDN